MFKNEFKRAIKSQRFLFIVIITIIISIYGVVDTIPIIHIFTRKIDIKAGIDSGQLNQFTLFTIANAKVAYFIPLISSFVFGYSFLQDRKNGFNKFINTRVSNKKYCISKFLANGIAAGLSVTLANSIFFYFCNIFIGGKIENTKMAIGGILDGLLNSNPYMFVVVFLIIQFLVAFCYSTIALAVSTLVNNEILVLLSPAVFYFITTYLTNSILKLPLAFKTKLGIEFGLLAENISVFVVILQLLIITLIFASIYFYFARKDFVYEG